MPYLGASLNVSRLVSRNGYAYPYSLPTAFQDAVGYFDFQRGFNTRYGSAVTSISLYTPFTNSITFTGGEFAGYGLGAIEFVRNSLRDSIDPASFIGRDAIDPIDYPLYPNLILSWNGNWYVYDSDSNVTLLVNTSTDLAIVPTAGWINYEANTPSTCTVTSNVVTSNSYGLSVGQFSTPPSPEITATNIAKRGNCLGDSAGNMNPILISNLGETVNRTYTAWILGSSAAAYGSPNLPIIAVGSPYVTGNSGEFASGIYPFRYIVSNTNDTGSPYGSYYPYYFCNLASSIAYGSSGNLDTYDFDVTAMSSSLLPNDWVFACLVLDGTNMKQYINGSLTSTVSYDPSQILTTDGISIGGDLQSWDNNYLGQGLGELESLAINASSCGQTVDEVGIWNRAFTAAEITTLYNSYF